MNGNDIAIEWRDEQIGMLKAEIHHLRKLLEEAVEQLRLECLAREQAEDALRNLKEEVAEWTPTP